MLNIPDAAITNDIVQELRQGFHMNRVRAAVEAKRIAQATHADSFKSVDGLGQMVARIPADAFHYWGQRLGYQCWEDTSFMREFLRDNPECRVKSAGTKLQVGYQPTNVRFHKTYADS